MIPFFTSHWSIGKSILTLEDEDEIKTDAPVSIISIAKKHELKQLFLVENTFGGFVQAYKHTPKDTQLVFGLSLTVCSNEEQKDEESFKTESKVIVFMKNSKGYEDLIRLYTHAATTGFYYIPRISWASLKKGMTENLNIVFPPYDNFIHKNLLENGNCVPDLENILPSFTFMYGGLPFDDLLRESYEEYSIANGCDLTEVHQCYFYRGEDFKAYQVFRAINNRSTFSKPNLEYFGSKNFSWENALNKIY